MNIPLGEWSGSKTTKDLEYTIERIQKENALSVEVDVFAVRTYRTV